MNKERGRFLPYLALAGAAVAATAFAVDHQAVTTLFDAVFNGQHLSNVIQYHNLGELFGAHHSVQAFTVDQAQHLHFFNQNLNYNYYPDNDIAAAQAFGSGVLATLPFGISRLFHRNSGKPRSSSMGAPKTAMA